MPPVVEWSEAGSVMYPHLRKSMTGAYHFASCDRGTGGIPCCVISERPPIILSLAAVLAPCDLGVTVMVGLPVAQYPATAPPGCHAYSPRSSRCGLSLVNSPQRTITPPRLPCLRIRCIPRWARGLSHWAPSGSWARHLVSLPMRVASNDTDYEGLQSIYTLLYYVYKR